MVCTMCEAGINKKKQCELEAQKLKKRQQKCIFEQEEPHSAAYKEPKKVFST